MKKKIKKKQTKNRKLIFIGVICVIVLVVSFVIFEVIVSSSFTGKLIRMGYSSTQADKIDEAISVSNHDIVLNLGKNDIVIDLINAKGYDDSKLESYLEYYKKNLKAPVKDIITIVNSGFELLDTPYTNLLGKLINSKYFIFDNLKRYNNYYNSNQNMDIDKIIADVNANLDKAQYEDAEKADTKDKNLILVNKYYYLTKDYEPTDLVKLSNTYNIGTNNRLRREAANAFMKMADAALLDNVTIKNASAYRDYKYQVTLYDNYVTRDGKEAADTYSARPGFSEHQTGLATDINIVDTSFENTDAFKWLIDNAYKYGFVLRFPKNKENITGYTYEPWHYRYVGKKAAEIMVKEDLALEEYYAYYVKNTKEEQ